jgi:hypothetical protein
MIHPVSRRGIDMGRAVDFSGGTILHPGGVRLEDVWQWTNGQFEFEHAYIQWLFPLPDRSKAEPDSPILTTKDMERFNASTELRDKLLRSFKVLLRFYGFTFRYETEECINPIIEPSDHFDQRAKTWLNSNNHNYLRITRILRCLTLLGLSREAREFFAALQRVYIHHTGEIGSYTYDFWKNAIRT